MTAVADLSSLPPITEQRGGDPLLLAAEIRHVIGTHITNHPRSQQKKIGPSEVGEPCARRLAHKMAGTPDAVTYPPAWRPTVGTAVHEWLADALAADNIRTREQVGASRWLIENRVNAGPCADNDLEGSGDAYDRVTATVIDWKVIGPSSHRTKKADIAAGRVPGGPVYRVQVHTYGLGYTRRGLPVDRVMIVFLPAAGELDDMLVWHEPFDPTIASKALERANRIHALRKNLGIPAALQVTNALLASIGRADLADPDGTPDALAVPLDGGSCRFCPWHVQDSTDLSRACPGDSTQQERDSRVLETAIAGLIPTPTSSTA